VERLFQNYQYGEAGRQIYEFFWGDFADWYLEIAKLQLEQGNERAFYTTSTLVRVLDICLRLLHPFTPFVTEELWGYLKDVTLNSPLVDLHSDWPEALIIAPWPEARDKEGWEVRKVSDFQLVQDVVRAIRNLRSEKNIKPGKRIPATIISAEAAPILRQQASTLAALSYLDPKSLEISETLSCKPQDHIALVVGSVEIYLPLAELVDSREERTRLEKNLSEVHSQTERLENLLESPFAEKAPPEVVQKERDKLEAYRKSMDKIKSQLDNLA
jgi:valyl-tRNA synthetase